MIEFYVDLRFGVGALLDDLDQVEDPAHAERLIPIHAGEDRAYLSVRRIGTADEEEIASRMPSFDDVLSKVTTLAAGAIRDLSAIGASKVLLEFGCEFGIESGQLVAIIGKASGKSTFKIGLEWSGGAATSEQ